MPAATHRAGMNTDAGRGAVGAAARNGPGAARTIAVPVTRYQQNCSLVWCPATRLAAVIDPGGDLDRILAAATRLELTLSRILLTHGHEDHAGAAAALAAHSGLPISGPHRGDRFLLERLPQTPAHWMDSIEWFEDRDRVTVGAVTLEVRHCPGHTPGHVVYVDQAAAHAWVGDVLFRGSIGATDSPYGDRPLLIRSIVERLWPYGHHVQFTPGHGRGSSFGLEREFNPFVGDDLTEQMGLTDPSLHFGED